jgi:hypothetical protein
VVFVSAEYAERDWTRLERQAALARAVRERREYVLPARFDDTPLPGLLPDVVAIDLRRYAPAEFAGLVEGKLADLGIGASAVAGTDRAPAGAVRVSQAGARAPQPPPTPLPVPPSHLARTFTGRTGQVCGVAFSPDGHLLATASWDGQRGCRTDLGP